jgi:large subunit ribosomal protein L35
MPKMKSRRAVRKRVRVTKTGKVMYVRAGLRHNLESKSAKRKRAMARPAVLSPSVARIVRRMLGGS